LLVYDVTDKDSFSNIRVWMRNIDQHANEAVVKVLLGNKMDMPEKKLVKYEEGAALAKEFDIQFFETSAKSNVNVDEAFTTIARAIKDRTKANPVEPAPAPPILDGPTEPSTKKKSGCC